MAKTAQAVNDCAALIVVMTPDSEDPASLVYKEIALAKERDKPIFPLLLAGDRFLSLIDLPYTKVTSGQMPPEGFYNALREKVPLEAISQLPRSAAEPAPALSRKYSLAVGYQNFQGERKTFAVDPRSIRIPMGRGKPSKKHLSMCVAPTGIRIALERKKISNLAEVERALARHG